jgi:hypothetical protein
MKDDIMDNMTTFNKMVPSATTQVNLEDFEDEEIANAEEPEIGDDY